VWGHNATARGRRTRRVDSERRRGAFDFIYYVKVNRRRRRLWWNGRSSGIQPPLTSRQKKRIFDICWAVSEQGGCVLPEENSSCCERFVGIVNLYVRDVVRLYIIIIISHDRWGVCERALVGLCVGGSCEWVCRVSCRRCVNKWTRADP